MRAQFADIDAYIASFPPEIQEKLSGIRAAVRRAVPEALEAVRYGIPTFRLSGTNLVHFAAFPDHLSFFPTASGVERFRQELSGYTLRKGTIHIPLDRPVPSDLLERIAKFRAAEVRGKRETGTPAQVHRRRKRSSGGRPGSKSRRTPRPQVEEDGVSSPSLPPFR